MTFRRTLELEWWLKVYEKLERTGSSRTGDLYSQKSKNGTSNRRIDDVIEQYKVR